MIELYLVRPGTVRAKLMLVLCVSSKVLANIRVDTGCHSLRPWHILPPYSELPSMGTWVGFPSPSPHITQTFWLSHSLGSLLFGPYFLSWSPGLLAFPLSPPTPLLSLVSWPAGSVCW